MGHGNNHLPGGRRPRASLPVLDPSPAPPWATNNAETPHPERRDARENRERILAVMRQLIKEKPVGQICMDEVAARAGVGKGTLYRRFGDRAQLCLALLDDAQRALQNTVIGLRERDSQRRLPVVLTLIATFQREHADILRDVQLHRERSLEAADAGGLHPVMQWQVFEIERTLRAAGKRDASALALHCVELLHAARAAGRTAADDELLVDFLVRACGLASVHAP